MIKREMPRYKRGQAKCGPGGKGDKVKAESGDRYRPFQGLKERQDLARGRRWPNEVLKLFNPSESDAIVERE